MQGLTVSASRIGTFKYCRKKFFFKYIEGLTPVRYSNDLYFGSVFHKGFAELEKKRSIGIATELMKDEWKSGGVELAKSIIALETFAEKDESVKYFSTEEHFVVDLPDGNKLQGYFDGICTDENGTWVHELKTTGAFGEKYLDDLLRDEQATAYIYGARKLGYEVKGVRYLIVQKPKLRQKKTETEEDYLERIRQWYKDENRFVLHYVFRDQTQLDIFERDLISTCADIGRARENKVFYPSPQNCKTTFRRCPYKDICLEDTPEAREGNFYCQKEDKSGDNEN